MTPIADTLADKFIGHEVNLHRLQASHRQALLKALRRLEHTLVKQIANSVEQGKDNFTLARNRALLTQVNTAITNSYGEISTAHRTMLTELGLYEAQVTPAIVNKMLGVTLMSVGVPQSVITAMMKTDTVFGVPLKAFWQQQTASLRGKFATEMRAGIFAGETNQQLIQRIRGTRAGGFKDGIMHTARQGAEVVVRTSGQSILNDARMEVYRANADVLDGVQVLVTLDMRTSDVCIARSGFAWDLEGNPLPGTETNEPFPGPPPYHPNCRSTLIPVLKSVGDLRDDADLDRKTKKALSKIPSATQSSMNGQVAGDLTYEQWLSTQEQAVQIEALGPGKYALWKKGNISLRDLIDQRGRPLSLAQLRKREA